MTMRKYAAIGALVALPLLTGMGSLGGGGSTTPERNYGATLTDRDGVAVDATWLAAGGELALSGSLGRGNLRIPFDDIERVSFSGGGQEDFVAKVKLTNGESVDLDVRGSLTFEGQTDLGAYRIRARDLATIEIAR